MEFKPLSTPFRVSLGERGEMVAWGHLLRSGYKILEKNYRCKLGEIDVIAEKNGRIFFIEVKTRTSTSFGRPEEAVGFYKQKKLAQLASWYLKEKNLHDLPISFEVLAILWSGKDPEIRMIENAFSVGE